MPLVNMSLIKTEADLEQQCLVLSKQKRALWITYQADHRDDQQQLRHLGVDVKVILTPPCIFCMDNH